MDYYGAGSGPSKVQQAKRWYNRMSTKKKTLLWTLTVLFTYVFFFRSSSSSSSSNNSGNLQESDNVNGGVGNGVSSQDISNIHVSFMDLQKPFLDDHTLKFYHYLNGGNMRLEKQADYVRLVEEQSAAVGYLFSESAMSESDANAFELEMEFRIHGAQKKNNLIGDGMALWLTDRQLERGDVFGMKSDYNGLGIFMDTYKNADKKVYRQASSRRFPYMSLQPNSGISGKYDKASDGWQTELAGCTLKDLYNPADVSKLKMIYVRKSNFLQIDVDMKGNGRWLTCVKRYDIPSDVIPRQPYIGVSAENGQLFEAVDVYRISLETFRKLDGSEIETANELLEKLQPKEDVPNEKVETQERQEMFGRRRLGKKKRGRQRRTMSRLRYHDQKNKRESREYWGNEHGFVGWFFGKVWDTIRFILYTCLAGLLGYILLIVYRVWREKQREKRRGGLL